MAMTMTMMGTPAEDTDMTRAMRLLLAVAAAAMVVAIALPLWEVRLAAPQYPEGLGIRILSHTVRGLGANDLNSINILNHYIGMKPIVPDSIPELRFMPWVIASLAAWLLLIAWRGGRRHLLVWLGVLVVAALVGLWDFWRWEYDYGHDLDLENLVLFRTLPHLEEVSIGHALISHALFVGLDRSVREYLSVLRQP